MLLPPPSSTAVLKIELVKTTNSMYLLFVSITSRQRYKKFNNSR